MKKKNWIPVITFLLLLVLAGCAGEAEIPETVPDDPTWQALSRVQAEVLAVHTVPIEEDPVLCSGYEESSTTNITVGFRVESAEDAALVNLESVQFARQDGESLPGTCEDSFWYNKEGNYAIAVLRVAGEIRASEISYTVISTDGLLNYSGQLSDEIVSFNVYKPLGASETSHPVILYLDGRHYINKALWDVDASVRDAEYGVWFSDTRSYVLVPLEGSMSCTLEDSDLLFDVRTEVELPVTVVLKAGVSGNPEGEGEKVSKYEAAPEYQTMICLMVETFVEKAACESESFDEAIFRQINKEVLDASVLTITSADGKAITFPF